MLESNCSHPGLQYIIFHSGFNQKQVRFFIDLTS